MVLKIKDYNVFGENDGWTYIDGIKSASVFFDKDMETNCVFVRVGDAKDDEGCVYPVNEVAYLMNDSGKTVDRVLGHLVDKGLKEMGVEFVPEK